ncbi:hypothetical protein OKW49_008370 [Paraburkholderia youngii]
MAVGNRSSVGAKHINVNKLRYFSEPPILPSLKSGAGTLGKVAVIVDRDLGEGS